MAIRSIHKLFWPVVYLAVVVVIAVGVWKWTLWYPPFSSWVDQTVSRYRPSSTADEHGHSEGDGHDHSAESHDDHAHDASTTLELSAQAMRNIGLTAEMLKPIELESFQRSITVPALVTERPGRSRVQVSTPMTGVVTHVHAIQGQAIAPGVKLFQIRMTHEDLVNAQTEFVKTLGELEVEQREVTRLQSVTDSGAVAGKVLLERKYQRDKLAAMLRAQREALRLHGLSENQIQEIADTRRLLREMEVVAPYRDQHPESEAIQENAERQPSETDSSPMVLQELMVHKGQSVNAGQTLAVLTDYRELFIEGLAFEQDIPDLRHASQNEWGIQAVIPSANGDSRMLEGLRLVYLANQVDPETRTLKFYVQLPNQVAKYRVENGSHYIEWKYLPGQRLQLRIPVQQWDEQIVLPVDAVAREGAESFVFQQNGSHFDRVPVHVKFRDQFSVVIENDGSLFPGDVVARRGAHQMQMALKNKSGGGVDPHAGHNH